MLVKCIDNSDTKYLTKGKLYKVMYETAQAYVLVNDGAYDTDYLKNRFEIVCNEQDSLKAKMIEHLEIATARGSKDKTMRLTVSEIELIIGIL